ncbi:MAG: M20/M25/M40 family metallo-hydrolase [Phycisphaerae bacterium]|nr:M20/M25/M40 family metallo-hydrolase [Phycisphaerae bacterium]
MPERFLTIIDSRRDALLDDLRLHVGTPTGGFHTPGLDRTRALLTDRLRRLGASIDLVPGDPKPDWLFGVSPNSPIPPTAVCRGPAGIGPPILLAGHLDTVHDPAGPFRELTLAPDGATATGPGCVDMKGGLVILVAALEALAEAGVMPNWTVVFNSDEETGSYHSEAVLRAEARRAAGGVGLAVEPALPDGSLAVERLGTGQFRIDARGRAAHVGRDFASGVSAVTALARALVTIGDLPDLTRDKIINVGPVEGGIATNVVPDRASAWGNVRFPSRQIADELQRDLVALERPGPASVHVRTSFNRPAKPQTPETLRLAALARHAAETLGQRLPFAKTGGVCDGNILQSEGLPTIDTLGVRGGGLHTPQEWIEIPSLVERCQLLALLMARIAAGAWT